MLFARLDLGSMLYVTFAVSKLDSSRLYFFLKNLHLHQKRIKSISNDSAHHGVLGFWGDRKSVV